MALPVWMDNLVAYSLQIAILASAGTLLAYLFRLRVPRVSLIYWQILLLACLLLPALQNWNHPVQVQTVASTSTFVYTIPATVVAVNTKAAPALSITPRAISLVLLAGVFLRLVWLGLGFLRLRLFLRNSKPMSGAAPVSDNLLSHIRVRVRFFLCHEIDSPATVGVFSPMVILPGSFAAMSEACREAIVCHELLHVRRRDWAVILIEEFIRSIYWFHPAVWWLLGRIHLAREQSVDHEVVRLTGSRQPYLDSLLEIARSRGRPKAVPAPLFLRERHLVQRVALLLKEVSMNRLRLAVSLAGIAVLLAGTVVLAAGWFPLTGAPEFVQQQAVNPEFSRPAPTPSIKAGVTPAKVEMAANAKPVAAPLREPVKPESPVPREESAVGTSVAPPQREPIKVGGNIQESKLIHRVEPVYPELAKRARVSGKIVLVITVNEEGFVSDVRVVSGHPLLNDAAITAVRQWHYSPTLLNGAPVPVIATVTVVFALDGKPPEEGSAPAPFAIFAAGQPAGTITMQPDGLGGAVLFRASLIDEKGESGPNAELFHAPELAMGPEVFREWHRTAEAGWPADVPQTTPIAYIFMVNEVGEIKNFMRVQGPEIPALEREITQVRIASPGLRGSTPVRSFCTIEIRLVQPVPAQYPPVQMNRTFLSGSVTDSSGTVLSGVTIKATNTNAGFGSISITNSAGTYTFFDLQPGSYRLSAEMNGFRPKTFPDIPVGSGAQIRINFILEK
jgi:TonB family protein